MRKIIVANHVSIDGFFAGSNGELDWFVRDDQLAKSAAEQLETKDTLLLGTRDISAFCFLLADSRRL
jgi:hypothetical protein